MTTIRDSRNAPFWWCPNKVIDENGLAVMGPSAALCYFVLLRHADAGGKAFPSLSHLQKRTGLARGTVVAAINRLVELRLIEKAEPGNSSHKSTVYEVCDVSDQFNHQTSSTIELVQSLNRTSSTIEPELVQPLNPKKTNRKRPIEKDQSFLNAQPKTETNKTAFSEPGSDQEQQQNPVEPTGLLPVQTPDCNLTGEGESSAAAQNQNFQPQYESSAAKSDRAFEPPPWGWSPAPEFLEYVVKNHLAHVDPYKSQQRQPSHRQAIAWLSQSKRDEGRLERASALYGDWQESITAAQSRPEIVAGPLCAHVESDRPDPEAARAGVALMKQAMQKTREVRHGLSA